MPRGNSDSSRDERHPDVTTVAPLRTARPFCTKSRIRSFGFPTVAFTSPFGPSGTICADTPLVWSVIIVTRAASGATSDMRPTRPAPLTTGWSSRTPWSEPLSIVIVEYHTVGERPITRARHGLMPSGKRADSLKPTSPRAARVALRCLGRRELGAQLLVLLLEVLVLGLGVDHVARPADQVATGFSARLAPSWRGAITSRNPRCTACRPPEVARRSRP